MALTELHFHLLGDNCCASDQETFFTMVRIFIILIFELSIVVNFLN